MGVVQRQLLSPPSARGALERRTQSRLPDTVIFLDIEGVLRSLPGGDRLKQSCGTQLDHIIRTTGAALIISGSWRSEARKLAMINEMLQQWHLPPWFDCT